MASSVDKVKNKAVKSAKWMIVTSIISMIFSYVTNIILGNISPEILGKYSAVNVFISSLTTFIGMGGAVVLSNFYPKTNSNVEKTQLLKIYVLMSFMMYIIFVIAVTFFPDINLLLSGGLKGNIAYIALFVMAPIFITMTIISYLLTAMLEARLSNIMTKLYALILPIVLIVLQLINPSIIEHNLIAIVFSSIITANIIAIVMGLSFIRKEKIIAKNSGMKIPYGFIPFVVVTLLQAIFSFLYRNADKMFLLSLGDMGQLGYYQSIISILTLVEFVPSLLGNVTIPYFSNILKLGEKKEIETSYERIEKYMLFFLVTCIIGTIAFSDVALSMFGADYVDYKYLLIILVAAKCISSLGFTNTPMMIVLEKNSIRLINSALQIGLQFAITFFTINKLGILGVVLGRTVGVCVAQIIPQLVIRFKSGYDIKISTSYFSGVFFVLVFSFVEIYYNINILCSIICGIVIWICFLFFGKYTKKDFISMLNMIIRR